MTDLELPKDRRHGPGTAGRGRRQYWTPESICEGLALAFAKGAPRSRATYTEWREDGDIWLLDYEVSKAEIFPPMAVIAKVVGWSEACDYAVQLLEEERKEAEQVMLNALVDVLVKENPPAPTSDESA